jgi:hypothetical protein
MPTKLDGIEKELNRGGRVALQAQIKDASQRLNEDEGSLSFAGCEDVRVAEQFIHSPEMVLTVGEIRVGCSYLERFAGETAGRLLQVLRVRQEEIVVKGWKYEDPDGFLLDPVDYGIIADKDGMWHPCKWLECVDCTEPEEPEIHNKVDPNAPKTISWLKPPEDKK